MSLHPSLQTYADAWTHSVDAVNELVQPLSEKEWNRPTPCPGWSVRDVVSHVIGTTSEALGDPRPIHSLPRDLRHMKSDLQRYHELQVDVRRHHTGPEMTAELEYTIIRRKRQLREDTREAHAMVRAPLSTEETLEFSLRRQAFDCWVHEQDLRVALDKPGNLDSPGALVARDMFLAVLPKVVAKDAQAPAGSTVVFDVHGPVEFLRTVRVDADGRGSLDDSPALGPLVSLSLDWEVYERLACGRTSVRAVEDRIKADGDLALAARILAGFSITP